MKIKNGYVMRKIADINVVVPVGETSIDFNGIITLNDTGAFLFNLLINGTSMEEMLKAMTERYDIDEESAKSDIIDFCSRLEEANLIA